MRENVESCDYLCNHRISTCIIYSYYMYCKYQNATMPKGKRACTQFKLILLQVYNYFDSIVQHGSGQGALRRTQKLPVSEHRTVLYLW